MKIAAKLKYKPNQLARGLRTGKTKTIGLIVEDIANSFFANVAKVVEDEADKHGYKVLFGSTEDNEEKAKGLLEVLRYRQVDGYIITPTLSLDKEIISLQKPVVLMDRYFPNVKDFNYVVVDNFQGAFVAVSHMVEQGYKKVAIITTTSSQVQMQQRLDGFMDALKKHDLPAGKNMIKRLPFDLDRPGFTQEITKYLANNKDLDAVFFATNYLGICGIESIRSLGLQIGTDLGMVSFDDHDIFRLLNPSITCVAQPIEEIGKKLIQLLIDEMEHSTPANAQIVLPLELRKRESTILHAMENI